MLFSKSKLSSVRLLQNIHIPPFRLYTQKIAEEEATTIVSEDLPFGWGGRRVTDHANSHSGTVSVETDDTVKPSPSAGGVHGHTHTSSCSHPSPSLSSPAAPVADSNPFDSGRHAAVYQSFVETQPVPTAQPQSLGQTSHQSAQSPTLNALSSKASNALSSSFLSESLGVMNYSSQSSGSTSHAMNLPVRTQELKAASLLVVELSNRIRFIREDMREYRDKNSKTYSTDYEYVEMKLMLDHALATHIMTQKKELLLLEYVLKNNQ